MTLSTYSRQSINEDDIAAVLEVLRSDYLTTGSKVPEFEAALKWYLGAAEVVVVSSGTAALHAALLANGVLPGDEVVTSPLTFVATANAIEATGARAVFSDIEEDTWLLKTPMAGGKVTAVVPVSFGGVPVWDGQKYMQPPVMIEDAAHAIGGIRQDGRKVGASWTATFSFHPVKNMTTGEGGAIAFENSELAQRAREIRDHGRHNGETIRLGFNYRMSDIHAALGISQLKRLDEFIAKRRALSCAYRDMLRAIVPSVTLPKWDYERSACHLFPVLVPRSRDVDLRVKVVGRMWQDHGIRCGVHYWPLVPHHQFYAEKYGFRLGNFPIAEDVGSRIVSLPLHVGMEMGHVERVVGALGVVLT